MVALNQGVFRTGDYEAVMNVECGTDTDALGERALAWEDAQPVGIAGVKHRAALLHVERKN